MTGKVVNEASGRITSHYGNNHTGVDIGWRRDENQNKVFAHSSGKVVVVVSGKGSYPYNDGTLSTYGNYVDIDHGNGYKTRYAHLRTVFVSVGQSVNSNTLIGVIGESGNAKGRHLHFEVFKRNHRINPEPYLSQEFETINASTDIVYYQSHDRRYHWNPNVAMGSSDYAGNFGISMDAIYVDRFRVRVHDMVKGKWLPWVQNRNDYAGNIGHAIDGVQIDAMDSSYQVIYRVHINGGGWLDWVSGYHDNADGYAGIYGRAIDAFEILDVICKS